jgi:hypothetical protein
MKTTILGISLLVLTVFVASAAYSITQTPSVEGGLEYHSAVCVNKNDDTPQCSHNLLTNYGKDTIKDLLQGNKQMTVNQIALCNSSATELANNSCATPTATDTILAGEYAVCGLSRTAGTFGFGSPATGNISWATTFTSTCDNVRVNKTALFNTSTLGASMFAANNFTIVTLQTNDRLTVTWYVWVT